VTPLWLLRHPPVNAPKGLCYGRLDLDPIAGWQHDHSADLAGLPRMEAIVSSPASRCRVLAEFVTGSARSIQIDPRWLELDFGDWEGRAFDDLPRAALDAWAAAPWRFQPPGGELIEALVQRVDDALAALAGQAGPILVVAHAGPIRVALGRCRGLAQSRWLDIEVPYACPIQTLIS